MNLGQRSKYPQRQRSHGPVNKRLHLLSNNVLKTGQLVTNAGIRLTALVYLNTKQKMVIKQFNDYLIPW